MKETGFSTQQSEIRLMAKVCKDHGAIHGWESEQNKGAS